MHMHGAVPYSVLYRRLADCAIATIIVVYLDVTLLHHIIHMLILSLVCTECSNV